MRWYLSLVQQFNIKPENTYNLDEIGLIMGIASSGVVLEPERHLRKNGKLFERKQDGNRDFTTVIETVCGDGTVLIYLFNLV
jgi:hypothetical protein